MAMFLLSLRTDLLISDNPAPEDAAGPFLWGIYADLAKGLLPVAIICAAALLCMAVWLVAIGVHLRSGAGRAA